LGSLSVSLPHNARSENVEYLKYLGYVEYLTHVHNRNGPSPEGPLCIYKKGNTYVNTYMGRECRDGRVPRVSRMIEVVVFGIPRPQGSLTLFRAKNGRDVAKYGQTVYEWRNQVTTVVRRVECERVTGPVRLDVTFDLPRPKGHLGTGRNSGVVKASSPTHPDRAPDLDKLLRAICDAITDAGNVWVDDGQVVSITARKRYADGDELPGAFILVEPQTVEHQ